MDNLNIHRRKSLADLYGAQLGTEIWNRFTVRYTPTHESWLNPRSSSESSQDNASATEGFRI
jgi:hypothetical protein